MDNEVIQRMVAAGSPVRKWHELLAAHRPAVLEHWERFSDGMGTLQELSEKTKELIVVAIDAVDAWPGLKPHLNLAFNSGATVQELIDVCVTVGWLKGPHALNYGLSRLHEVIEERQQAALPVRFTKNDPA